MELPPLAARQRAAVSPQVWSVLALRAARGHGGDPSSPIGSGFGSESGTGSGSVGGTGSGSVGGTGSGSESGTGSESVGGTVRNKTRSTAEGLLDYSHFTCVLGLAKGLRPRTRARGAFGALHQSSGRLVRWWCLERKDTMLIIYQVVLSFVEDVAVLTPRIAHHDPDLARQLRRASSSVALNIAEVAPGQAWEVKA